MEQRHSRESNSCLATQEVPYILCSVKVIVYMYLPYRVNLSALHILQMQQCVVCVNILRFTTVHFIHDYSP
jgi:hypothetical protein